MIFILIIIAILLTIIAYTLAPQALGTVIGLALLLIIGFITFALLAGVAAIVLPMIPWDSITGEGIVQGLGFLLTAGVVILCVYFLVEFLLSVPVRVINGATWCVKKYRGKS